MGHSNMSFFKSQNLTGTYDKCKTDGRFLVSRQKLGPKQILFVKISNGKNNHFSSHIYIHSARWLINTLYGQYLFVFTP